MTETRIRVLLYLYIDRYIVYIAEEGADPLLTPSTSSRYGERCVQQHPVADSYLDQPWLRQQEQGQFPRIYSKHRVGLSFYSNPVFEVFQGKVQPLSTLGSTDTARLNAIPEKTWTQANQKLWSVLLLMTSGSALGHSTVSTFNSEGEISVDPSVALNTLMSSARHWAQFFLVGLVPDSPHTSSSRTSRDGSAVH